MKHISKFSLLLLFAALLCGCSNQSEGQGIDSIKSTLPVISIETVSKEADVMDFVTEPVVGHVSADIASWTPGYKLPPEPYYEDCTISLTNIDGTKMLDAVSGEVKVRGNWTTTYDKKPLRIKFDKPQDMLRMNGGEKFKNWLLLAEYKDASMLRNKTALSIARDLLQRDGHYVADAEFVEVFINGEYWGVYLLTEMQQVNENRVNIASVPSGYTGTDIGYFLELDGYYMNEDALHRFHVNYADNGPLTPYDGKGGSGRTMTALSTGPQDYKKDIGISIISEIHSPEQRDFIAAYVNNVYEIMYAAAYRNEAYCFNTDYTAIEKTTALSPREAVEQVVDLQSLIDTYILNEVVCDADLYWSSFYMTADFGEGGNQKLTFEAPWDFDSALGNKSRCSDGTGFYAANIIPDVNGGPMYGGYETINPWLAVLAHTDWYQELVKDTWTAAYDDKVFDRALQMIETDAENCKTAFAKNYMKWNNIINNDAFVNELSAKAAACKNETEAIQYLSDWLKARVEFLNSQWHR